MAKTEGNLIVNKHDLTGDLLDKLKAYKKPMHGAAFSFVETEGEALKEFFEKHGNHYQTCLERISN